LVFVETGMGDGSRQGYLGRSTYLFLILKEQGPYLLMTLFYSTRVM